jgi:hypothetical protein
MLEPAQQMAVQGNGWTGHHATNETKGLTEMWLTREDFEPVMVIVKVWDSAVDSRKHC